MSNFLARARVVLGTLVTYLVMASAVVTIFAEEIASALPESAQTVGQWAVVVLGVLGAAIGIIRRVTPVLADERGLLPVSE